MRSAQAAGGDRPRFERADFTGATFCDPADFSGALFEEAIFTGAIFEGPADFRDAHFANVARFDGATFEGTASFRRARFWCRAEFELMKDVPEMPGLPEQVRFRRWADFRQVLFFEDARFGGARFDERARFEDTWFGADAWFEGTDFSQARTLGRIIAVGRLVLNRASFGAPLLMMIGAQEVLCQSSQFLGRTSIELHWADLDLEYAEFAQPAVVSGMSGAQDEPGNGSSRKASVSSLRRANVGNLTLADLDLTACHFAGAHNLDGLRFEGGIDFAPTRGWWRTKRRRIAEEDAGGSPGQERLTPDRIARIYRALRKGREDNKDEPGAADFYYGEMEMRRRARRRADDPEGAARTSWFERTILRLYWLVSGYGLRASRALMALVVTVVAFAVGFAAWGFAPDQGFGESLLFSAESSSSLLRAPSMPDGAKLKDVGHILQLGLRLLGPLFFGLALLALRGRVKR
jgi:uncharacterized protein YjbI with pentapeptide repeats